MPLRHYYPHTAPLLAAVRVGAGRPILLGCVMLLLLGLSVAACGDAGASMTPTLPAPVVAPPRTSSPVMPPLRTPTLPPATQPRATQATAEEATVVAGTLARATTAVTASAVPNAPGTPTDPASPASNTQEPTWFATVPNYATLQLVPVDATTHAKVQALTLNPNPLFLRLGVSPDPVLQIATFYSTTLTTGGWTMPSTTIPPALAASVSGGEFRKTQNGEKYEVSVVVLRDREILRSLGSGGPLFAPLLPANQTVVLLTGQAQTVPPLSAKDVPPIASRFP